MEMMVLVVNSDKLKLVLNSARYTNENGDSYVGYGFTAFRTDPMREVFSIEDLSVDANEVQALMRMILDNDVDETHFQDLIDDFCV